MSGRLLKFFFCFIATTWAVRRNEQGSQPEPDDLEASAEDVTKIEPIPGSQTWYKVNKLKKSVHGCGASKFCCMRGCKYIVEQDACGECKGHNVKQATPEEEVKQYQAEMGNFRIPSGIDYAGRARGCTQKHAVKCIDKGQGQDQKNVCCCNSGFIFDFNSRQCVTDLQNDTRKEEPIPGTETWGFIKGTARKKIVGTYAKKCAWHPKKWCCNRGCEYLVEQDKCGDCKRVDEKQPPPPKENIKKFIAENGNYVIPRSIAKPRTNGVCWIKHAKKCVAEGSTLEQCCCYSGFYFSFASRKCLEPAQLKQDLEQDAAEDREAEERAARDGPTAEEMEGQDELAAAVSRNMDSGDKKNNGGAGRTCISLLLLAAAALQWC